MATPTQASSAGLYDKFYYSDSGDYTAPNWIEIDGVQDLDFGDECNAIAIKIRRFRHELNLRGQRKKELTFNLLNEVNQASWIALNNAYNANPGTVMDFLVMIVGDVDTDDSIGFRFQGEVVQFGKPQKLEDGDFNDVKVVPSARIYATETEIHEPEVYVVSA